MVIKPASSRGFLHYSNQETTDTGACKQIGFNLHLPLCISISCRSWQDCADTLTTISVTTFVDNNWSTVGRWSSELQKSARVLQVSYAAQDFIWSPKISHVTFIMQRGFCLVGNCFTIPVRAGNHMSLTNLDISSSQAQLVAFIVAASLLTTSVKLIIWPEQQLFPLLTQSVCIIKPSILWQSKTAWNNS